MAGPGGVGKEGVEGRRSCINWNVLRSRGGLTDLTILTDLTDLTILTEMTILTILTDLTNRVRSIYHKVYDGIDKIMSTKPNGTTATERFRVTKGDPRGVTLIQPSTTCAHYGRQRSS